jgi:hypothetical protein
LVSVFSLKLQLLLVKLIEVELVLSVDQCQLYKLEYCIMIANSLAFL